jgi:hypothetical protein
MDPIARVLIVDDQAEQATALAATLAVRLLHLTRQLLEVAKPGRGARL